MKGRRGRKSSVKGGGGRSPTFSSEQEVEMANALKIMSKNGFGLSRNEVINVVQKYVSRNKIKTPFKNGRPGQDWWLSFKKRHNLSILKLQPLESARKKQTNPWIIYGFYDLLEKTIQYLGIQSKPQQIWNCDETSFCHDPSQTKVLASKGEKSSWLTAATGRENTSVLACVNAAGEKLPPFAIFKGKNLWDSWIPKEGDWPNTVYSAQKNGWMTAELFERWFTKSFVPNVGSDRPALLIFDRRSSHVTPELITAAQKNLITIFKLPAHTFHILQPLDVACFSGMKSQWDQQLVSWQRQNFGKRPGKEYLPGYLVQFGHN